MSHHQHLPQWLRWRPNARVVQSNSPVAKTFSTEKLRYTDHMCSIRAGWTFPELLYKNSCKSLAVPERRKSDYVGRLSEEMIARGQHILYHPDIGGINTSPKVYSQSAAAAGWTCRGGKLLGPQAVKRNWDRCVKTLIQAAFSPWGEFGQLGVSVGERPTLHLSREWDGC